MSLAWAIAGQEALRGCSADSLTSTPGTGSPDQEQDTPSWSSNPREQSPVEQISCTCTGPWLSTPRVCVTREIRGGEIKRKKEMRVSIARSMHGYNTLSNVMRALQLSHSSPEEAVARIQQTYRGSKCADLEASLWSLAAC